MTAKRMCIFTTKSHNPHEQKSVIHPFDITNGDAIIMTMKTTLVIDDDVLSQTRALASETERPFRVILNEVLRAGLDVIAIPAKSKPYRTRPRKMRLKAGLDINSIQGLMALADGEDAR